MKLERIDPRTDPRYALERELRYQVLRAPLGLGRSDVGFAGEERAVHVLALEGDDNQVVIGCVLFDFASGRLRAMAVDPTRQKQGIGVLLVQRLEAELRLEKIGVVSLHARDHAVGFYARLGYAVTGEPFTEVGIPHFNMVKTL